MNTYNNLRTLIINKRKTNEELLGYMDVFLMNNRITSTQYEELVALMNGEDGTSTI